MVGEDSSEEAEGAAKLAAPLGRLFGADVRLVLAVSGLPGVPQEARHRPDVLTIGEALRRSEQYLVHLSEDLAEELGRRPQTEVVEGERGGRSRGGCRGGRRTGLDRGRQPGSREDGAPKARKRLVRCATGSDRAGADLQARPAG